MGLNTRTNIIFFITSRSILLRMRNVSDKTYRENQNTHFTFNCFFFNHAVYEMMWETVVQREPSRAIRTERGMTKLMVALRNFANGPRNEISTSTESP